MLIIVFAFVGGNRTRRNYFRVLIVWLLVLAVLWSLIMALGFWPMFELKLHHGDGKFLTTGRRLIRG